MKKKYSMKDVKSTIKETDAWWGKIVLEKPANIIIYILANYTKITPNQATILSLILAIITSILFVNKFFILGAFIYQFSMLFDTVDGRLARLTKNFSKIGEFLDNFTDQIKVFILTLTLGYVYFIILGNEFNIYIIGLFFTYLFLSDISVIIWLFVEKRLAEKSHKKDQGKDEFNKIESNSFVIKVGKNIIGFMRKLGLRPLWTNFETNALLFTFGVFIMGNNFVVFLFMIVILLLIYFILELIVVFSILKK